jgi:acyl-homoserine lactone synthase
MLHVSRFGSEPTPDGVLRSMFAARKSVFVDLLKWDVPVIDGTYEVDQFDDEHATYLVLADTDHAHLASARLLPTTRPHILGDLYTELCDTLPPQGRDIFEITRFCLDRRLSAADRRCVRDHLVTGLVDHALTTGITSYVAIAGMGWFQQILTFGWQCRPLGSPVTIDGVSLIALSIEIDPDTPSRLAAAGIGPVAPGCAAKRAAA